VNVTALTIVSAANTVGYTLQTGSNVTLFDVQRLVQITLSAADLNAIKALADLATGGASTVLTLSTAFAADKSGNAVTAVAAGAQVTPVAFVADTTDPKLIDAELDLTTDQLTMRFSETVNASSLDVTAITLVGASSAVTVGLTGGSATDAASTEIVVDFNTADINAIKRNPAVGVNVGNTKVSIATGAVLDMSGNPVAPVTVSSPLAVSQVTVDSKNPVLLEFDLSMNTLLLRMSFSEPMNIDTFDVTTLKFVSSNASLTGGVTLSGGSTSTTNSSTVEVTLTASDANVIKATTDLCTGEATTFLVVTSATAVDIKGNSIVGTVTPVQVTSFVEDTTAPIVSGIGLDMNEGKLTINFTETVNASSLLPSLVGFASSSSSGVIVGLDSNLLLSPTDTDSLVITLSSATLNGLKADTSIATSSADSYLQFSVSGVVDMNGNPVSGGVVQITVYIDDVTSPKLDSFELDMNNGVLFLSFSETVKSATLNRTQLTLLA
jgi:hypothetical protein